MGNSNMVWGLDIGIGSCGWAVLDNDNETIVDMGVRLWDIPQEKKTKASLAQTRRAARSARRNIKRTSDRKKHCLRLLQAYGLVPENETAQWLQTRAGEQPTISLRAKGLDHKLTEREWAQVLYSLCSRRGYIPHGETRDDADAEGKRVLSAIKDNERLMAEGNFRTIGEMLAHQTRSRNRAGDYSQCVANKSLVHEVKTLFETQKEFGNQNTSESLLKDYLDVMLWQKDVSRHDERTYQQVGFCTYEVFKNEKRAAKSTLSFELCRAYEQLGHARIVNSDGSEAPLPPFVRSAAVNTLFSPVELPKNKNCKVTYGDLRKQLDLPASAFFKNVPEDKEKTTKVADPKAWAIIRKTLPENLVKAMRADRHMADAICEAATYASSASSLEQRLADLGNLTKDEIECILELPYTSAVFNGYGSRSLSALSMLINAFEDEEDIVTLSDAEQACGLQEARLHGEKNLGGSLPPFILHDPTNNNPVVLRVMGQVRRVINALYAKYGAPDAIRVELARELKQSEQERRKIAARNRETSERRDALREKLSEEMGVDPELIRGKDIRAIEFHEMQGGKCPYCGKVIHYDELIRTLRDNDHAFEIDHILPFSRTCDDSLNNKVLSHVGCNQNKRARTPYEWITEEGLSWDDYVERIAQMTKLPRGKRSKLLNKDLSEKVEADFIARNLNDTRYASRATLDYINSYLSFGDSEGQHVFAVAGGATALLRNAWGIKKIREDDDLHHAIDAAIIASCTPSLVQQIARASERKKTIPKGERANLFKQTEPWQGFGQELQEWKGKIVPSRKVEHGVSGRAFEDTLYWYEGMSDEGACGLLRANGSIKKSTNFVVRQDGSATLPDGIAFVRLWWDPDKAVRGRKDKPGKYLIEPVYYADIPSLQNGSYIPRVIPEQTDKKDRSRWDEVPERIRETTPLVLFRNDAIDYKGTLMRFGTVKISSNTWILLDPLSNAKQVTEGFPLSGIGPGDMLEVVPEDVLGHSLRRFLEDKR